MAVIAEGGTLEYYITTSDSWTVMVTDDDAPENITGKTIYFTIKRHTDDDDPGIFQTTLSVVDGPAGEALLEIAPSDLVGVAARVYCADLKYIKTADADVSVLWTGEIEIKHPVTAATS